MTRTGIASPCPATTGIPASGQWRRRRSTTSSTDFSFALRVIVPQDFQNLRPAEFRRHLLALLQPLAQLGARHLQPVRVGMRAGAIGGHAVAAVAPEGHPDPDRPRLEGTGR